MLPSHWQYHHDSHRGTVGADRLHQSRTNGDNPSNDGDSDDDDEDRGHAMRGLPWTTVGTESRRRDPPLAQDHPPLGVTGVICTSHRLPLPHYDGRKGDNLDPPASTGDRGNTATFLHYTIFRPRQLQVDPVLKIPAKPPLVAVAGGPLLPSYYLQNLVHTVTDRSIVLYDPVGCGQSSRNQTLVGSTVASIPRKDDHTPMEDDTSDVSDCPTDTLVHQQARDLVLLLQALNVPTVHLLGHSLGGCVAYECLRLLLLQQPTANGDVLNSTSPQSTPPPHVRLASLILVSAPVSIRQSRHEAERLRHDLTREVQQQRGTHKKNNDDSNGTTRITCDDSDDDVDDEKGSQNHPSGSDVHDVDRLFWERHECRVQPMPLLLEQSLRNSPSATSRCTSSSSSTLSSSHSPRRPRHELGSALLSTAATSSLSRWAQDACASYEAAPLQETPMHGSVHQSFDLPPILVVRGEFDCCTAVTCGPDAWRPRFVNYGAIVPAATRDNHRFEIEKGGAVTCTSDHAESCLPVQPPLQIRSVTLSGCAHFGMVENERLFGTTIVAPFLREFDPK